MTLRPDVIDEIRNRLATINNATDDFNTSIGQFVTFGSMTEPLPSRTPGVNFVPTQEVYYPSYGKNARQVTIQIEAFQIDRVNEMATIANNMLEDIDRVLLYDDGELQMTLGDLVYEIRFVRFNPFILTGDPPLSGLVAEYNIVYEP